MRRVTPLPAMVVPLLLSACVVRSRGSLYGGSLYWPNYTIFGVLHLLAVIWACYHIWGGRRGLLSKLVWTLLVFAFPVGGIIFFWIFGDRRLAA